MSLDYVKKGESVKATTINSILETIGGNQRMSPDLNVTTTSRGPQVSMPSNYGGPNNQLRHYLDTGKYVLSGWQFVQLVLGPTLDDCLDIFNYHTVDGEVVNPISAAFVFQNGEDAPIGGDLSGFLLSDGNFGLDVEAYSAGFVQTPMEDTNGKVPVRAELWSWKLPDKMAAVFTNVEDKNSVKDVLSGLLQDGGVGESELSSIQRVGSWRLTSSTSLSSNSGGETTWYDTHELVDRHGTIDIWASESFDTQHVNTAEVVCYNVETHDDQQTGEKVLDNAKYAWKYWLGPDSEYEEGESISFVYSHGWTINGQPAVFKVDSEISDLGSYDGSTVAIRDERGGYSILYGEFESSEGGSQQKIEAGELYVNFNYYDSYAAMIGELGVQNTSTTSNLSRSCFLAKQNGEFKIEEDKMVSPGDTIPRRFFTFGTWSAVDKDWPLTDEMCPENDGQDTKSKKSLEWKDNKPAEGNTEPVDETGVKSLQLYKFSDVVKSDCDKLSAIQLSDQLVFVARREDEDGNAWIDYINMDDLTAGSVDSKISTLYLSSIQEMSYHDSELSSDIIYHQLFNFENEAQQLDLGNLDKFDVVVRDRLNVAQGAQINYIPLSSVLSSTNVFTDTQVSQMSSIQYDDDGNGPYLELFQFNQGNRVDIGFDDFANYDLVVRDNNGGVVDYATLSGICDTIISNAIDLLSVDVDSELPSLHLSSIQTSSWTDQQTNEEHEYHQLFNFQLSSKNIDWSSIQYYDVVLRDFQTDPNGAIVHYTPLSDLLTRPDSDGNSGQSSISFLSATHDIQLYKFDENGQGQLSSVVPSWWDNPSDVLSGNGSEYEFVLRKGGAGGEIEYRTLALKQAQLSVDRDVYPNQRSLQWNAINGKHFLELDGFHGAGTILPTVNISSEDTSLLPNADEFLFRRRDPNGYWQLNYAPLSVKLDLSSLSVDVDTDHTQSQKSIEWAQDQDGKYLQLYKMDQDGQDPNLVTLKRTGVGYNLLPDDYEFVVRSSKGGQIDYMPVELCCMLSGGGGNPPISGDNEIIVSRKSIDLIEPEGQEPYYQLHNFQNSPIPGPETWMKFYDQPLSGEDFSIGCNTEFVVRVPNGANGYEVKYMQLSAYQEHERVDSYVQYPRGNSIIYASYDEGYGCYQALQLYGFDWGCSHFITSSYISSDTGNGILIRKWDNSGCCWQLDYMNFDSLDELAIKYIGDSQLSLSAHTPYNKSTTVWWDEDDKKKYVELYGFRSEFDSDTITIRNDGCTYYWPQDIRNDESLTEWDYILVKHVDSNGNITLRYTQLQVEMPDISGIEGDITNIYGDINNFYDEINYLSVCIDELSGHLSGDYWESGGDSSTCYGRNIADSNQIIAIELDDHILEGNWYCNGTFYADYFDVGCSISLGCTSIGHTAIMLDGSLQFTSGCSYFSNNLLQVDGTITAGCGFQVGCTTIYDTGAYFSGCVSASGSISSSGDIYVGCGCTLTIGGTSINEQQLSALLRLI